MNKFQTVARTIGATLAVAAISMSQAHAALDTGTSTALGDAKTDAAALGALALLVFIAIACVKWLRRAL